MRISFYGNFGAGNLGNECTLQAIIEKVLQYEPDAQLLVFLHESSGCSARAITSRPCLPQWFAGDRRGRGLSARFLRIFFAGYRSRWHNGSETLGRWAGLGRFHHCRHRHCQRLPDWAAGLAI